MPPRSSQHEPWRIERLRWTDVVVADFATPRGRVPVTLGLGSGLGVRAGDGTLWCVADRGPNMTVQIGTKRHGLPGLARLRTVRGARILPRPDVGPSISQLRIRGGRVTLRQTLPLRDRYGRALSGLPLPGRGGEREAAFDLAGRPLGCDPGGADTEGIAPMDDGTFWVADEYGPSLLRVASDGRVLFRLVPRGLGAAMRDARQRVRATLPSIARRRRLNRGFEAIALSRDGRHLHVMFQSALSRPGRARYERDVRVWTLDARTGRLLAQHLYPFDPPQSFVRDARAGQVDASDLKICDAVSAGDGQLLVLERVSRSTKIYRVRLEPGVPQLRKTLVFSTDDAPRIDRDLEGLAMLSPRQLLLVTDNDFGVEGAHTRFWRVTFRRAIA